MGKFSVLRPLPLPSEAPCLPESGDDASLEVREARNRMRDVRKKYAAALDRYTDCDAKITQVTTAHALFKAKLRIDPAAFGLEEASLDDVKAVKSRVLAEIGRITPALERVERDAARRLHSALCLLYSRRVAESLSGVEQMRTEVATLYRAAVAVNSQVENIRTLAHDQAALYALLSSWAGNEENLELSNSILRVGGRVHERLQEVSWGLRGDLPYPFEHADGAISLEQYVLPSMPPREAVGDLFQAAVEAINKLLPLQARIIGRLVLVAEQTERLIGLEPLPDLPDETMPSEQ